MPAASNFAEIRALLRELPGPDLESATRAIARERELTKPNGALGRLEDFTRFLATWQGRHPPAIHRPRVAIFAGNHGIAAHGVSAYPAAVTAEMVKNFIAGGAAVNQICRTVDAELRVYELALDQPTRDFTLEAALSEEACVRAMAYGMTAVEPGIDLLALGEMGIGNTTSAAALCVGLFGGEARSWTGAGTGVTGERLSRKIEVVAAGVARHRAWLADPLEALARLGGHELAAIAGAILAARMARVPVLLDGYAATAAAAVLWRLDRATLDHTLIAHLSAEPGHRLLAEKLNQRPLLDLGLRLGEASGAALAIGLMRAAVACHQGMATFAEAAVSTRID